MMNAGGVPKRRTLFEGYLFAQDVHDGDVRVRPARVEPAEVSTHDPGLPLLRVGPRGPLVALLPQVVVQAADHPGRHHCPVEGLPAPGDRGDPGHLLIAARPARCVIYRDVLHSRTQDAPQRSLNKTTCLPMRYHYRPIAVQPVTPSAHHAEYWIVC